MRSTFLLVWAASCCFLAVSEAAGQDPKDKRKAEVIPPPLIQAPGEHACPPACAAPCKVCVRTPAVKKKTTVLYGCKQVEYCLPLCSFWGRLVGGCGHSWGRLCGEGNDCSGHSCGDCKDSCPEGGCEGPRTKRVLLKRVVIEECPITKCEIVERPGDCCPAPRALPVRHGYFNRPANHCGAEIRLPAPPSPVAPEPSKQLPR